MWLLVSLTLSGNMYTTSTINFYDTSPQKSGLIHTAVCMLLLSPLHKGLYDLFVLVGFSCIYMFLTYALHVHVCIIIYALYRHKHMQVLVACAVKLYAFYCHNCTWVFVLFVGSDETHF